MNEHESLNHAKLGRKYDALFIPARTLLDKAAIVLENERVLILATGALSFIKAVKNRRTRQPEPALRSPGAP